MHVPGFNYNPIMLAIEGAVIGFVIAVPVGPAAAHEERLGDLLAAHPLG